MPDPLVCPECRAILPTDAPRGLCPKCLMGAAFSKTAAEGTATDTYATRAATVSQTPIGDEPNFGIWAETEAGEADPQQPALPVGLEGFRKSIQDLGLIRPSEFDRFVAGALGGVAGLAKALVQAGKLTPYQAKALAQGKARGLVIGNYLVLDKIGAGGMGVVFKAKHRRLGRIVALKILPPALARNHNLFLRFRREVDVAARLNHPNIVGVLDADEDRGVQFMTMEYIQGNDLDRLVRDGGELPVKQALDCVIQAARGLEAAHAQGIVHRDIKPGNLMLDGSGQVKVLDLGLARLIEAANPFSATLSGPVTQSGTFMGTVDFMAPEQGVDSSKADHRADIYSLGCTLHFLLTARPPFEDATVLSRLMAHQSRPAPSLSAERTDVSLALNAAYARMMAKEPGQRPASMTDVIALLEACRSSASEAEEARAELKTFSETVQIKRAGTSLEFNDPPLLASHDDLKKSAMTSNSTLGNAREDAVSSPKSSRRIAWIAIGMIAVLGLGTLSYWRFSRNETPLAETATVKAKADLVASKYDPVKIFDGTTTKGWKLGDGTPLPANHIQPDGLNPFGTSCEMVVYEKKVGDFVLDFDYKITTHCTSGVFLRVGNPANPQRSGLEVQIDNKTTRTEHDSGAFYSLVAPRTNAQKPLGEWNHMKIRAEGEYVSVSINNKKVTAIHLDEWTQPGHRPDGSKNDYKSYANIAIFSLPRAGYVGFQNNGGDCWYKNIVLQELPPVREGGRSLAKLKSDLTGIVPGEKTIDLLALVTPGQDTFSGEWETPGGALLSMPGSVGRMEIPYVPPSEYRIDMDVERQSNEGEALGIVVMANWHPVLVFIDGSVTEHGFTTHLSGLDGISSKSRVADSSYFQNKYRLLPPSHHAKLSLTVRWDKMTLLCDGKKILDWKGNMQRFTIPDSWRPIDQRKLLIGSNRGSFLIKRMTLTPLDPASR